MQQSNVGTVEQHPAVTLLKQFFAEMHSWEAEMLHESELIDKGLFSGMDDDAVAIEMTRRRSDARGRLAAIFEAYCLEGSKARRVKDVLHNGGNEPDYNPEKEKIVSVSEQGEKVIVESQMTHNFCFRLRYEIIKINGGWKIRDNRKCSSDFRPKWSRWDL